MLIVAWIHKGLLLNNRSFYFQDSLVVVRACEAALILVSLPSMIEDCCALDLSFTKYAIKLAEHVGKLCQTIPDDMDNGDIEDCAVAWG